MKIGPVSKEQHPCVMDVLPISKLEHLSRMIIDIPCGILSNTCASRCFMLGTGSRGTGNDRHKTDKINGAFTATSHKRNPVESRYREIQTIKHETTFEKSKSIFCLRHLSMEAEMEADWGVDKDIAYMDWTRTFDPVYMQNEDVEDNCSVKGNVNFSLRSLNGPCGIWTMEAPSPYYREPAIGQSTDEAIQQKGDYLRYYVLPQTAEGSSCSEPTHILVTKTWHPDLSTYNPLHPAGPWLVQWNPERNAFIHLVKQSGSSSTKVKLSAECMVRFHLDESVLGATSEQQDQFAQETFVSFSECQTRRRHTSGLVDNHETTGPLRVILASGCYRWPGGIVLHPSGSFRPDKAISCYHAFHARVSREVLIRDGGEITAIPEFLDEQSTQRAQDLLNIFRLLSYAQAETLSHHHSEIVSYMRAYLLELSSGIEQLKNLHALKRALQPFVLFLASNCLDVHLIANSSTPMHAEGELQNFVKLYRFVLGLLPDRKCHQVFRDCLGVRMAMAIDND